MVNKPVQLFYCDSGVLVASVLKSLQDTLKEHPHATIHCSEEGYIVVCGE
jgi:hypothetical protein